MEALLGRHVEIDAIGSQGKTALHHAIEKGNLDLVRAILEYKPGIYYITLILVMDRKALNLLKPVVTFV